MIHLPQLFSNTETTITPIICRICLEESAGITPDNKFITPCNCKGTVQYVHEECLQNWIRKSLWKHTKDKQGVYFRCQACSQKIYFTIGSESWTSWYQTKPCSAIFYFSWIVLLIISFVAVVFLVIEAITTARYELLRFLGLPLGFLLLGGFLFLQCGKDFRDYQTGIVHIEEKSQKENKPQKSIRDTDTTKSLNTNSV